MLGALQRLSEVPQHDVAKRGRAHDELALRGRRVEDEPAPRVEHRSTSPARRTSSAASKALPAGGVVLVREAVQPAHAHLAHVAHAKVRAAPPRSSAARPRPQFGDERVGSTAPPSVSVIAAAPRTRAARGARVASVAASRSTSRHAPPELLISAISHRAGRHAAEPSSSPRPENCGKHT